MIWDFNHNQLVKEEYHLASKYDAPCEDCYIQVLDQSANERWQLVVAYDQTSYLVSADKVIELEERSRSFNAWRWSHDENLFWYEYKSTMVHPNVTVRLNTGESILIGSPKASLPNIPAGTDSPATTPAFIDVEFSPVDGRLWYTMGDNWDQIRAYRPFEPIFETIDTDNNVRALSWNYALEEMFLISVTDSQIIMKSRDGNRSARIDREFLEAISFNGFINYTHSNYQLSSDGRMLILSPKFNSNQMIVLGCSEIGSSA